MPKVLSCFLVGLYVFALVQTTDECYNTTLPLTQDLDGLVRVQKRAGGIVGENVRRRLNEDVVQRQ